MTAIESEKNRQLEYLPVGELELLELRDVRNHVVDEIVERIEETEYNPARPMRVVEADDRNSYDVIDGNHRLSALRESGQISDEKLIPCVVEPDDVDVYKLAHDSNQDEKTFAKEDLFDHLDYISQLRDENTQSEIAETMGWSRTMVADHQALLNNIVAGVLDLARSHQTGRETQNVSGETNQSFAFTEYWFRTSGLYDLNRDGVDSWDGTHAQMRVMDWFVNSERCDASKAALNREVEDTLEICEQLELVNEELNPGVDDEKKAELRDEVTAGSYTYETLEGAIKNANNKAKDRAEFGTGAISGLQSLESDTIDCVVTDPPYGVDYESHRDTDRESFPDGEQETMRLLDDTFEELERVCKANAHVYVFFSMRRHEKIKSVAERHFDVQEVPLIWTKNNHVPTQNAERGFEKMYAQKYETILLCRIEGGTTRKLNGGTCPNVLNHGRPSGKERYHDAQKPRSLLTELIENSTGKQETVLDPFAGSGSTLLAAAEANRHYIGFEQSEKYSSRFKKEMREVTGDE
jgi:site-specific DNA-methyltransferase (adenine-specific)